MANSASGVARGSILVEEEFKSEGLYGQLNIFSSILFWLEIGGLIFMESVYFNVVHASWSLRRNPIFAVTPDSWTSQGVETLFVYIYIRSAEAEHKCWCVVREPGIFSEHLLSATNGECVCSIVGGDEIKGLDICRQSSGIMIIQSPQAIVFPR